MGNNLLKQNYFKELNTIKNKIKGDGVTTTKQ